MKYNSNVLDSYAGILYGLSVGIAILWAIGGAIVGGLASAPSGFVVGGAFLGLIADAIVGWISGFLLRVSAQLVLCFVMIEKHLGDINGPMSYANKSGLGSKTGASGAEYADTSNNTNPASTVAIDDQGISQPTARRPVPMPESCEKCEHYTRDGFFNYYKGHCRFYDKPTFGLWSCRSGSPSLE